MQLARKGRRVWPIDCGPTASTLTNVHRRVHISMAGVAARCAEETRLRRPIGLLTMPTGATRLTGIRWVDIDHPHASERRLVGNEGAELEEAPRMQHTPLAFRTVDSAADMRQVFQRHAAPCAFRRADHRLRQTMIHILANRFSRPLRFLSSRLADFVPSSALLPKRLKRARTWFTWLCFGPAALFRNSPSLVVANWMMPRSMPTKSSAQ